MLKKRGWYSSEVEEEDDQRKRMGCDKYLKIERMIIPLSVSSLGLL